MQRLLHLAVCCALLACQRSTVEDPDDVARLHRSIDALRKASNRDKAPYLDELRSAKCVTPPFCELKQACADAYTKHVAALAEVRALADARGDSPASRQRLDAARRTLIEAERLAQRCVALQASLRDGSAGP